MHQGVSGQRLHQRLRECWGREQRVRKLWDALLRSHLYRHHARHQHHCLHRRRPLEFITLGLQRPTRAAGRSTPPRRGRVILPGNGWVWSGHRNGNSGKRLVCEQPLPHAASGHVEHSTTSRGSKDDGTRSSGTRDDATRSSGSSCSTSGQLSDPWIRSNPTSASCTKDGFGTAALEEQLASVGPLPEIPSEISTRSSALCAPPREHAKEASFECVSVTMVP